MATSINTGGISIGSDGKLTFSGISSGIDSKAIIEAQMLAKRLPAIKLESKIASNVTKIAAYGEFKAKVQDITTALDKLRGAVGSSSDVFKSKTATGVTVAAQGAPVNHVPSDVSALMTASIQQNAIAGTHTIKVEQLAKAQQIRGDLATSSNTALGQSGTLSINGQNISVVASDTLLDIRSKINAVSTNAGVTATVVTSSPTENYLVLTSNRTGEDYEIDFGGGNALSDALGLTTGGAVKNELQQAQNARLTVNGIPNIERSSNEISNIIEGVTFKLTKAEPDTEIQLKIETDLNTVKGAMVDFVEAYNAVRAFVKEQRTAADRNNDGKIDANEVGPLAYDSTVRSIMDRLGELAVASKDGNEDGFQSLSQMGITLNANYDLQIDDTILDSRLLTNVDQVRKLFTYDVTVNDARMTAIGRTAETQEGTYYINISGTDHDGNVLSANVRDAAGMGTGGADDESVEVSNKFLVLGEGGGYGLSLYFNGSPNLGPVNDIAVTVSRGIADSFYDFFNDTVKTTDGTLDTMTSQIQQESDNYQSRVETIDARLEVTRKTLESKFIAMETMLAQLEQLRSTISSYFDTSNSDS